MTSFDYDLFVIGAGSGGVRAARIAAKSPLVLKLLKRTRDRKWLDRARRFAMHALEQRTGEHGLLEGDLGIALYLRACIDVDDRWPLLDVR